MTGLHKTNNGRTEMYAHFSLPCGLCGEKPLARKENGSTVRVARLSRFLFGGEEGNEIQRLSPKNRKFAKSTERITKPNSCTQEQTAFNRKNLFFRLFGDFSGINKSRPLVLANKGRQNPNISIRTSTMIL